MPDVDILVEIHKAKQAINALASNRERLLTTINYWLDHLEKIQKEIVAKNKEG